MEITWYGLGCFRLIERGYPAIITDPFDEEASGYALPRTRAEIVTLSQPGDDPREVSWARFRGQHARWQVPANTKLGESSLRQSLRSATGKKVQNAVKTSFTPMTWGRSPSVTSANWVTSPVSRVSKGWEPSMCC